MSFDDDILDSGLPAAGVRRLRAAARGAGARDLASMAYHFRRAQRRVEAAHFRGRKLLLRLESARQLEQRELGHDPYTDTLS
jgi:hypothetical protein